MENQRPVVFGKTWGEDRVDSLGTGKSGLLIRDIRAHECTKLGVGANFRTKRRLSRIQKYRMCIQYGHTCNICNMRTFLNLIVVSISKFKKRIHRILHEIFKKLHLRQFASKSFETP